jgi:hypothetical protein
VARDADHDVALLRDWTIEVDVRLALRGQGASDPEAVLLSRPAFAASIERVLPEGRALLEPLVLVRSFPVIGHHGGRLALPDRDVQVGPAVAGCLSSVTTLTVVLCTVGPRLDEAVDRLLTREPARALLLDGIGTAAVDDLAQQAVRRLSNEAVAAGLASAIPCWPDRVGWPPEKAHPQVLALLGNEAARRFRLLPSGLLWPLKSESLVLGLAAATAALPKACPPCGHSPLWGWGEQRAAA